MKRIIVLMIVIILAAFPATAFAKTSGDVQTQEPSAVSLWLDTRHVYEGMEKSYGDGYAPSVSEGCALVVLPLMGQDVSGPLNVTVGLGDPQTSPFSYKNYQKQFFKGNYAFKDGTAECYLVRFLLPLAKNRVNGNYPVVFTISGKQSDGNDVSATFTVYVPVTDGKAVNTGTKSEDAQAIQPKPKLMVERYSLDSNYLEAGKSATLTVTVKNTSTVRKVKNVKLLFSEESGEILPDGTGAHYCKEIAKGGKYVWNVRMNAVVGAQSKPHIATITMEYEDTAGNVLSAADKAVIEIRQMARLEYEEPSLPARVTQGDTPSFSMNLMNMGKSAISNVLLKFDIPGLLNGGSVLVGTIAPGESKAGTTNFKVGKDVIGDLSGTLRLSYDDDYGEHFEKTLMLSTKVEKKVEAAEIAKAEKAESKTISPWWFVGGTTILISVIGGIAIKWRKLRKERERDEARL